MPTKIKGCRNCSRRRINCDRTQPHCRKCVRDDLECYGLEGTFRWMAEPVGRRARQEARKVSVILPPDAVRRNHRVAHEDAVTPSPSLGPQQPDQWVTNYFAEQITPWMCPILQVDNECKMHLLPLAMSSPLVFDAVASAAYNRLAYYGNSEFTAKAERFKACAIRGLISCAGRVFSSSASSTDKLFAAATLLILMYGEMIAAHDAFTILARLISNMRGFINFSTLCGSRELRRYLAEQFGILTLFSLPHADNDFANSQKTPAFEFVEEFSKSCNRHAHNPPFLAECFKTILTVWYGQRQNQDLNADTVMLDLKTKIESMQDISRFDHYLTWVYFMASAASSVADLRKFFRGRLLAHTMTFGWKNVAKMHQLLGELEVIGTEWPSRLQLHKTYICA